MSRKYYYSNIPITIPSGVTDIESLNVNDLVQIAGICQIGGVPNYFIYDALSDTFTAINSDNVGEVTAINNLGHFISNSAKIFYDGISFTTFSDNVRLISDRNHGLNDSDQIIGYYVDGTGSFIYEDGTYTTISIPGVDLNTAGGGGIVTAINNLGDITGTYIDSGETKAFLYSQGVFTSITTTFGQTGTFLFPSLNDSKQVVGVCWTDATQTASTVFVWDSGNVTLIAPPGAEPSAQTNQYSINNSGQILGSTRVNGVNNTSFICDKDRKYIILDSTQINTAGGQSMNNLAQVKSNTALASNFATPFKKFDKGL